MKFNRVKEFFAEKEVWPFVVFWIIGIFIISGRLIFDLKTYFLGSTLVYREVSSSGYNYLLHLPKGYTDFDGPRPLIIFLHGAGEVGKDVRILKKQDIVGFSKGKIEKKDFPFIVVSPMTPIRGWHPELVIRLLEEMLADHGKRWKLDEKRVYLTGFSMGGRGTFSIASVYPERFAAIVPVAGCGEPKDAIRLKDVPTWAFHGKSDTVMPFEFSSNMIETMKRVGCDEARLCEIENANHSITDNVYTQPMLYQWLLKKKKSR